MIYETIFLAFKDLTKDLGGTAGCVVASRLSDADPSLSILIVERGPDGWRMPGWSANDLIPYMSKVR